MPWKHRRCIYLSLAMTLEFGPEGSVRGFQTDKIGRAFQAEAAGCVRLEQEGIW